MLVSWRIEGQDWVLAVAMTVVTRGMGVAACGGDDEDDGGGAGGGGQAAEGPTVAASKCGLGRSSRSSRRCGRTRRCSASSGNTSFLDCGVNQKFYERDDVYMITAGVPRECFEQPSVAAVNMGPNYSALGAAQALVHQGAKSLVAITARLPGADYNNEGVLKLADKLGIPGKSFLEPAPYNDGAAIALKAVEAAGDGGGVVITTPGQ